MSENRAETQPGLSRTDRAIYVIAKGIATAAIVLKDGPGFLRDSEGLTGLLEKSIIAPQLCYPDETIGALVLKAATGGQFMGFDFERPKHFPQANPADNFQVRVGNLWSALPNPQQSVDQKTPTYTALTWPVEIGITFSKRPLAELIEKGLLNQTTHEQAYEAAGAEDYIDDLRLRRMADATVYQVTPKGNSMIALIPDAGERTPRQDEAKAFEFAKIPGLLAH